uniref:Metalloendopeptidase n=1 Tax=Biomphalaria glabrata TaxID=6526 RepID=A0A2C9JMR4_BIOGL
MRSSPMRDRCSTQRKCRMMTSQLFQVSCRSIDELIAGASESSDFYLKEIESGSVMRELDMILTTQQYNALYESSFASVEQKVKRWKRKATRDQVYRWPKKEIPYEIVPNIFSTSDMREINAAIAEWQNYTCITFRRATRSDENYVSIDNGDGCSSRVGMIQRPQTLGLARGCRVKGIIIHELGHAVGFFHEQNRPDRDDHVTILKKNINSTALSNFRKYPVKAVNTYGVPYDYSSVMHYGGRAFSNNEGLTIQTKDPRYQNVIGNREGLSFNDIKLASLMYKCHDRCGNIQCPQQGFVGKDCRCWCPGSPVQLCAKTGTVQTTPKPVTRATSPAPTCSDMKTRCQSWMTPHFLPLSSKSIDELIAGASEMSNFYLEDMEEGTIRRELDMETNIALSIDGEKKRGRPRPRRKAIRDKKYRWTNKEIPYRIVPNDFDVNSTRDIYEAIAEWQNYTCITFRSATNSDPNFVEMDNGNGCYSNVGMAGGSQTVGL